MLVVLLVFLAVVVAVMLAATIIVVAGIAHVVAQRATGAATDVGAAPGGVDIQTLAFDPNGVLYGAGYHIYTIDPVTGQRTLSTQMSTFVDIRGIEFISAVPEPSAIALVLAGAGIVAVSARRRKMAA